jgi:hypothetical protein
MKYYKIQVIEDFEAPIINAETERDVKRKLFNAGQTAVGYLYSDKKEGIPPIVIIDEMWAIPKQYVKNLGEAKSSEVNLNNEAKQVKDKIDNLISKNSLRSSAMFTKSAINGMLWGAIGGLALAWLLRKPKTMFVIGGGILGGYVGRRMGSTLVKVNQSESKSEPNGKK